MDVLSKIAVNQIYCSYISHIIISGPNFSKVCQIHIILLNELDSSSVLTFLKSVPPDSDKQSIEW